jgi:flavin reductase (DIM6/NTAB) family NADH-FMN oxidoreductase RutF
MTEWHFYEPRDGHRLPHDPLNAMVAPRPIGWISTVSASGVRNIAPYSFFQPDQLHAPADRFFQHGA